MSFSTLCLQLPLNLATMRKCNQSWSLPLPLEQQFSNFLNSQARFNHFCHGTPVPGSTGCVSWHTAKQLLACSTITPKPFAESLMSHRWSKGSSGKLLENHLPRAAVLNQGSMASWGAASRFQRICPTQPVVGRGQAPWGWGKSQGRPTPCSPTASILRAVLWAGGQGSIVLLLRWGSRAPWCRAPPTAPRAMWAGMGSQAGPLPHGEQHRWAVKCL